VVFFVDDVNMPARESFGAQPPIELLRQLQDLRGFYDRKGLFWKDVEETALCAACAPPGGGRQEVTPRFLRHFAMLAVPPHSDAATKSILTAILGGFLSDFAVDLRGMCNPLVNASVEAYNRLVGLLPLCCCLCELRHPALFIAGELHRYSSASTKSHPTFKSTNRISEELLPTPAKSHYTFNMRDLSKVFQGLLLASPRALSSRDQLARLWLHESCRVFHDRLTCDDDRVAFKKMLVSSMDWVGMGRECWHTGPCCPACLLTLASSQHHPHACKKVELGAKHGVTQASYEDAFSSRAGMWVDFMRPGVCNPGCVMGWDRLQALHFNISPQPNCSHTPTRP